MKEIVGDIFDQKDADIICFTANGVVKSDGTLTMGKGLALEFKKQYPKIPAMAGAKVKEVGSRAFMFIQLEKPHVVSIPTKHHWKDQSDLALIEKSVKELVEIVNLFGYKKVVLPRPGTGLGQLLWISVKKVIEPLLDDRFYIITPK